MYLKSMAVQLWRTLGTSFHPWLVKQALLSVPGTGDKELLLMASGECQNLSQGHWESAAELLLYF